MDKMRKEYKKPNMETMAFETSYGVLDDIISKNTGGSTEDNPPSIHAKPYNGWQMESWEEQDTEKE